jgi:galactoside O-acetyltransferase
MSSFYSDTELANLGLKSYGQNVKISKFCRIYNPGIIEIGNNVRIDDFCILSANLETFFILEDFIHISAGVYIYGYGGFHVKSYSNLSASVKIYSVNDDYSGPYLVGPTVPTIHRNIQQSQIIIEKYVVIGCNSVVLPNSKLNEGVSIGCNSLVKSVCNEWSVYAGTPLKYIKKRQRFKLIQ